MLIEKLFPGWRALAFAQSQSRRAPLPGACPCRRRESSPTSDPLLDLFIKKGYVTQEEAMKVKEEADARLTNAQMPAMKWKISDGIKSIELFGDIRLRFEDRQAEAPNNARLDLSRFRYALRLGLRGDLADNFNYGLRLETASNPRSPWVTFGGSSSGAPYQGPFGKSTAALSLGQIYLGWRPADWVELTAGKCPTHSTTLHALGWRPQSRRSGGKVQIHRGRCGFLRKPGPIPI